MQNNIKTGLYGSGVLVLISILIVLAIQIHPLAVTNKDTDLQQIYTLIQTYRLSHDGKYPNGSLFTEVVNHYREYGFKNALDAADAFVSPDNKLADHNSANFRYPERTVSYTILSVRPDHTQIGTSYLPGEKDVIATTDIYNHSNSSKSSKTGRVTSNPSGYYLILRSDGQIEKIPYDDIYLFPTAQNEFTDAYPEQPGVPENSITYAEFYKQSDMDVLIGKPTAKGSETPVPDNGGPEALITFSRLFNYPSMYGIDRAKMWQILSPAQEEFSLDNIKAPASTLGLPLQKKTITLDDLQKLHTPAMLSLGDAGRIITMSTIDDTHAIILDRGMTLIVSRAELAKRYGGEALIAASVNAPSSLQVDQPIRMLNFSSKDAEVTQNIKITNHDAQPVSLLIERPLCGITDAKLSQDNLAPGESANLELHFKWRTVLPGDHQSTFVTLKTNDPAQPRLQLGFDLKLTETK